MENHLGLDVEATFSYSSSDTTNLPHPLGTTLRKANKVYVLALAGEALDENDFVKFDPEDNTAMLLDKTEATSSHGARVGVAAADISSGDAGWVQVAGIVDAANVATGCAAFVPLYTSATSGRVDDTAADHVLISGAMALDTAASNEAEVFLDFPTLAAAIVASIDPATTYSSAEYTVGTTRWVGNKQYQFVGPAGEELTATKWVRIDDDYSADLVTDTAECAVNDLVGVAETTIDSGDYGWVTVAGYVHEADVAASFGTGTVLYGGLADGNVDDADGGDECTILQALALSGIGVPSAGHASFMLLNPYVSAAGG